MFLERGTSLLQVLFLLLPSWFLFSCGGWRSPCFSWLVPPNPFLVVIFFFFSFFFLFGFVFFFS